jgi:hypothetical protein
MIFPRSTDPKHIARFGHVLALSVEDHLNTLRDRMNVVAPGRVGFEKRAKVM